MTENDQNMRETDLSQERAHKVKQMDSPVFGPIFIGPVRDRHFRVIIF